MFRDAREELERLQQQLLEEDGEEIEEQIASEEEEFLQEEDFDALLYDTDQGENPQVYENFSNDYGRGLRNYATGYKAYNADNTELDPQDLSEELLGKKEKLAWYLPVLLLIMAALVGAVVWWFAVTGGLF